MHFGKLTRTRRFALSALLLQSLAACPAPLPPTPQPPASKPAEVVVQVPTEALKSMCLAWFNSLPTWQDSDAERTKDEIDYAYRANEAQCLKYLG